MWSVSDAYKEAVAKQSRKWKAEVKVTYKNGEQAVFTDETIMDGITIDSQMLSGDAGSNTIDIGAVPEKKIELTLIDRNSDLHRYAEAKFSVHTSLRLENGNYEPIPMGVFFVDSNAITRLDTRIHIVGYDGMVTFQYNLSDDLRKKLKGQTATRAAQLLAAHSACGFNQNLSGFPNGNIPLDFDNPQVVTGWDGIMWIAQVMGCFGRINRQNYLEFIPIKFEWEYFNEDHTSGKIIETRTIQDSERYDNTTFSDDRMHIVGVAMPGDGKFITSGGFGGLDQDANITILLEKNPIIVNSGKTTSEILNAIRKQLWTVYFYAFQTDIENDPALDAGDVVRLKGGVINGTNKNNDLYGFITHSTWHYQGRQTITSTGQMPIVYGDLDSAGETETLFRIPAESQSNKKQLGGSSELEKRLAELEERIATLEDYITPLEKYIATLEARIDELEKSGDGGSSDTVKSDRLIASDGSMWVATDIGRMHHYNVAGLKDAEIWVNGAGTASAITFAFPLSGREDFISFSNTYDGNNQFLRIGGGIGKQCFTVKVQSGALNIDYVGDGYKNKRSLSLFEDHIEYNTTDAKQNAKKYKINLIELPPDE